MTSSLHLAGDRGPEGLCVPVLRRGARGSPRPSMGSCPHSVAARPPGPCSAPCTAQTPFPAAPSVSFQDRSRVCRTRVAPGRATSALGTDPSCRPGHRSLCVPGCPAHIRRPSGVSGYKATSGPFSSLLPWAPSQVVPVLTGVPKGPGPDEVHKRHLSLSPSFLCQSEKPPARVWTSPCFQAACLVARGRRGPRQVRALPCSRTTHLSRTRSPHPKDGSHAAALLVAHRPLHGQVSPERSGALAGRPSPPCPRAQRSQVTM